MAKSFEKLIKGYADFQKTYTTGDESLMRELGIHGQKPEVMMVACSDSRVDPSVILQSEPGEMFVVRNVANIIPPYEMEKGHHGTSAALEFGICYLNVKHLVILGHSQCGGIKALLNDEDLPQDDFISSWVSLLKADSKNKEPDQFAKLALTQSHKNCLSFPWIKSRVEDNTLQIHLWFFDIKKGALSDYSFENKSFRPLKI